MNICGAQRGAYHRFSLTEDGAAQAAHFLATVQLGRDDLPPVVDVELRRDGEVIDSAGAAALRDGVQTWLTTVQTRTVRLPIIYANPAFSRLYLGDQFGKYPLWVRVWRPHAPPSARLAAMDVLAMVAGWEGGWGLATSRSEPVQRRHRRSSRVSGKHVRRAIASSRSSN